VRRTRPPALLLVALLALLLPLAAPADARDPEAGDFIAYSWARHVGSGSGEYAGYSDNTYSSARLEIQSVNATRVHLRSAYNWSFASNEGDRQSGSVDRAVEFDPATRRWTGRFTDDDDHDAQNAADFTVWFWIPVEGLAAGDSVDVLDDTFTVVSMQSTVWSGWLPRRAVELRASGTFSRNDEYGVFQVTYEDVYFYDAVTGYVIAERYTERDRGTWQGRRAEFTWTETVDVTASSYPIETDVVSLALVVAAVAFVIVLLGLAANALRWRSRGVDIPGSPPVRIRPLRRAENLPAPYSGTLAGDPLVPSVHFSPLLHDFARRALLARDRVVVATGTGALVGLATLSRDAKVGQVFAQDTTLAEAMRGLLGAQDFFSEFRHSVPEKVQRQTAAMGLSLASGDAYNLMDEYHVLRLDAISAAPYDTTLVRRMKVEDLPAAAELAHAVYRVDSRTWLGAQLEAGDLGFVARVDGLLVGFAFASLVGDLGRLHTVTVSPTHRGRGIGRELVRARLNALHLLGARRALVEIGAWNLASLHLAVSHGFSKVGTLWVETTRSRPAVLGLQRR